MKNEHVVKITIHNPELMTKKGRRNIANWMRRQARFLENHGDEMQKRFTARYMKSFASNLPA